MLRKCLCSAILAAFVVCPTTLFSAIISRDFHNVSDGHLTYDTQSGREWLDISETIGATVDEVDWNLQRGQFVGFKLAFLQDVLSLISSAGLDVRTNAGLLDVWETLHVVDILFDNPYPSINYRSAFGLVADNLGYTDYTSFSITAVIQAIPGALNQPIYPEQFGYWASVHGRFSDYSIRRPVGGFWMYRDTVVPEPSLVSLTFAGTLGICWRSRARTR